MNSALGSIYAQKGIVVRVEVPEEIWAGESRPIYAVLNGKYNDGSSKCGDIPWTYDVTWQFAEPVWEEEGSGDDITYTPRPPDTADEYIPSTILAGGHRLKTNTSPLYVGDMTSSAGGLTYVRAVIAGVNVSNGEVTQGAGDKVITSAWVKVNSREDIWIVDDEGYEIEDVAMYYPHKTGGYTKYADQDAAELFFLELSGELNAGTADTITAGFYEEGMLLTETGPDSLTFTDEDELFTVAFDVAPSLDDETVNAIEVVVDFSPLGLDDRELLLIEEDEDSNGFRLRHLTVTCALSDGLEEGAVDTLRVDVRCSHSPDGHVAGIWLESAAASRVFRANMPLDEITIAGSGALNPTAIDLLTLNVSLYSLGGYAGQVVVTETSVDSRIFVSHSTPSVVGEEYPVAPPQAAFHPVLRRWPGIVGEKIDLHILTAAEEETVPAHMMANGLRFCEQQVYGVVAGAGAASPAPPEGEGYYGDWPFADSAIELELARDMLIVLNGEDKKHPDAGLRTSQIEEYEGALLSSDSFARLKQALTDEDWARARNYMEAYTVKPITFHPCAFIADVWKSTKSNRHMDFLRKRLWLLGYTVIIDPDLSKLDLRRICLVEKSIQVKLGGKARYLYLIDVWYLICHTMFHADPDTGSLEPVGLLLDDKVIAPNEVPQLTNHPRLLYLNACRSGTEAEDDLTAGTPLETIFHWTDADYEGDERVKEERMLPRRFQARFNTISMIGNPAYQLVKHGREYALEFFEQARERNEANDRVTVKEAADETNNEIDYEFSFGNTDLVYPEDVLPWLADLRIGPNGENREWYVIDKFRLTPKRSAWWTENPNPRKPWWWVF